MITRSGSPSGERSLKEVFASLVEAFGEGWEKGDGDRIADVFTEDAVFSPMPFDAPVRGKAAILSYWKDIPRSQAEIRFRAGEIFVAGPWFSTEFKCTFRRRRTGEWVEVRGSLFCETAGEKVSEMRMYWHRTVGAKSK